MARRAESLICYSRCMKSFWVWVCAIGGVFYWPLLLLGAMLLVGQWLENRAAIYEEIYEDDEEDLLIDE